MSHDITADWNLLLDQSVSTTATHFWGAKNILEKSEIKHTAADVIALANIMAYDFRTTSIGVASQNIRNGLNGMSEALGGIEFGADSITEAIYHASKPKE